MEDDDDEEEEELPIFFTSWLGPRFICKKKEREHVHKLGPTQQIMLKKKEEER